MFDVSGYASFLQGLKSRGGKLFVSGIFGDTSPVSVELVDGDEPRLEASCSSGSGDADPAIRVAGLAQALGSERTTRTICNDELGTALEDISGNIYGIMSGRCLSIEPVSGSCTIADVEDFGGDNEFIAQSLPDCAGSLPDQACSTLVQNSPNCPGGTHIEVTIDRRGTAVPVGSEVVAACI